MAFNDELRRAFDTLNDALRDDLSRRLGSLADELVSAAEADRAAAVSEAVSGAAARAGEEIASARAAAERDVSERLAAAADAAASLERAAEERGRQAGLAAAHQQQAGARERLVDAVRALDRARSLSEILDTLVSCAAREASRAGVLMLAGSQLRGWRFVGFGSSFDAGRTVQVPITESGIVGQAAAASSVVTTAGPDGDWPAFAGRSCDGEAAAVPLVVGGQVVGVLYADQLAEDAATAEQGSHGSSAWAGTLELIARHATRCLELVAACRAAQTITAPVSPNVSARS